VLHLPERGSGDGGVYTTAADIASFWSAFIGGRIVSMETVETMVRPHSEAPEHARRYGLGFWLHLTNDTVLLEGYDAGATFRSCHSPSRSITWSVLSNTSNGAWPVVRRIEEVLKT
jgi:CubicO group peptidase (beta-lactamase class C family)